MKVISSVLPVIAMLVLGKILALTNSISEKTISEVRNFISNILLPVVIFNALLNASLSLRSFKLSLLVYLLYLIMLMMNRWIFKSLFSYKTSSFLMVCCEGGMIGYSLYTSLFDQEALSSLMELDLGNMLFAFSVFILLIKSENKENKGLTNNIKGILKTPLLSVVMVAIFLNLAGIGRALNNSKYLSLYTSLVEMISSPVNALILITIGYNLSFNKSTLKEVLKVSILRLIMNILSAVILLTLGNALIINNELKIAVLIFAILPPSFITPVLIEDEEESAFASTVISFYIPLTIVSYVLIAAFLS